jgi:hypothetical protein
MESASMVEIIPFSKECAFDPQDVSAMSLAFDEVCKALDLPADAASTREVIAIRIIELAKRGGRNPSFLRDQVLSEAADLDHRHSSGL